jgi:hypothetical protein
LPRQIGEATANSRQVGEAIEETATNSTCLELVVASSIASPTCLEPLIHMPQLLASTEAGMGMPQLWHTRTIYVLKQAFASSMYVLKQVFATPTLYWSSMRSASMRSTIRNCIRNLSIRNFCILNLSHCPGLPHSRTKLTRSSQQTTSVLVSVTSTVFEAQCYRT